MKVYRYLISCALLIFVIVLLGSCNMPQGSIQTIEKSDTYLIEELNNISYYSTESSQPDQTKLNLVLPKTETKPPVLMWIGQGAWAYVDRNQEMNICRKIAEKGIATVSVGHRLSPALVWEPLNKEGIQHPEHVKDIALAFKWVYENADHYGYSKENIFIGGYSSGAHLAALLAMDNRYLMALGLSNQMIRGIIPVGGGYDIPHYREDLIKEDPDYEHNHINPVFGESHEQHLDASPTQYIDSLITPMLMISENSTYKYSLVFEELLAEKKNPDFQVLNVHNRNHMELWQDLGKDEENIHRNYMVNFILDRSKWKSSE